MWRALVFLGLLCLAASGAVWLANNPETIAVTWAGREYSTSLAVGAVVLVAAAILISAVLWAIRSLVTLPSAIGRSASRRKLARGHQAVSRGIVAIGSGDIAAARRHAGEAERLLGHQPLALLLKAQAAQASGDRKAAEAAFGEMTRVQETRVLGLRGLYLEARRRDDPETARLYAEEANRLAPALGWASDAVIEGHSADGDWRGAIRIIERRTSLGLVDRATSRRQRAVLLTADALAREPADLEGALAAAQDAVKLAPDLVPAASLAARLLSRRGDTKRAAKIIETAWTALPHPDLAGAYLNLRSGDSATDRLRRAETLARLSSWSPEARLAIARAAIEAREIGRARDVLKPLLEEGRPTVQVCMTMAELEGRGGNAGGAREWLARATRAPRDKAWIADGFVADSWAPVSPVTGRLDAFLWDTPPDLLGGPGSREDSFDLAAFEPLPETEPAPELASLPRPEPEPSPAPAPDVVPIDTTPPAPQPAPSVLDPKLALAAAEAEVPPTVLDPPPPAREAPEAPRSGGTDSGRSRGLARTAVDPVVFPVAHAPDDPGLDSEADRRQRFRLRV